MIWLEDKYVHLVKSQLDRFTSKGHAHTYNFRCPLCGDSEKSKLKTRGYIYPAHNKLFFKCHNCNISLPFVALLKQLSLSLYNDYLFEKFRENALTAPEPVQQPLPATQTQTLAVHPLLGQVPVYDVLSQRDVLSPCHAVYAFCHDRLIPDTALKRLYCTKQAFSLIQPLVGDDKTKGLVDAVPYLLQPLKNANSAWIGVQIRRIDKKEFYTFRWADDPLKMFGLDAMDASKTVFVVEGPIDSLFLPNAIAACGSDLLSAVHNAEDKGYLMPNRVLIWDNEPRNSQVRQEMKTAIKMKESLVIWTPDLPKDINDMVREGIDVQAVIANRTFSGISAEVRYSEWVKS